MPQSVTPQSSASTLEWARYYVARGWSAVPARLGTKFPAGEWLRYQTNLPTDAQLADWFGQQGFVRLGIVTGKNSGVIVADFDGAAGMDTLAALDAKGFPQSIRQFTPSGGCHVLLKHPGPYIPTRKWRESPWLNTLPGMDIRGDGGFIMAAPSIGAEYGRYDWDVDAHPDLATLADAPQAFIDLISQATTASGTGKDLPVTRGAGPLGLDLGQIIDGRETYMRNTVMAVTRGLFDRLQRMPTEQEVFEEGWPQYAARVDLSRPGRGENEFRAKVKYTLARIQRGAVPGFTSPAAGNEPPGEGSAQAPGGGDAEAGPDVFQTYGIEEIISMPPPVWLVEGIITTDGVGGIYGPPGSLKSFLALGAALSIAYGQMWMGRKVTQTGVLYVAAEGVRGLGRRIRAWQKRHNLVNVDAPFRLLAATVNLTDPLQTAKLIRTAIAAAEAEGCHIGLVIIDTVARAMAGADENSAQDMGRFIAGCDAIKQEVSCAVLGIHHSGKDKDRGARGSSAFLGAMDMLARVERSDDGQTVTLTIEKQKEDEEGAPIRFGVVKVDIGSGFKPETSLVLELEHAAARAAQQTADEREARLLLLGLCASALGPDGVLTLNRLADAIGTPGGRAREAIKDAIPLAPDCVEVPTADGIARLWRARQGEAATAPFTVRRKDM